MLRIGSCKESLMSTVKFMATTCLEKMRKGLGLWEQLGSGDCNSSNFYNINPFSNKLVFTSLVSPIIQDISWLLTAVSSCLI